MPSQYLERDPNALSILLRGQSQIPMQTDEEAQFASMIPDEQLYQAQEAIGEHGRQGGGAYAIPSRESLKQSGLAELRKLFGLQQAKGQAAAYPNRVAGEYGLREAQMKGGYDVEAAKQKAIADAAAHQQAQQFQQQQQERQQAFLGGQGELNRSAIERNTAAGIAGRQGVADTASTRAAANQKAIDARKNPPGLMSKLFGALTGGPDEAAAPAISPAIAQTVATLKRNPRAANLTAQQLFDQGVGAGSTPEALAEFAQAWGR